MITVLCFFIYIYIYIYGEYQIDQGRDPLHNWKVDNAKFVQRVFDKKTRGYVILCSGPSSTRLQLPKDVKKSSKS